METPRVNPVGVVEVPEGFETRPRSYSPRQRMLAATFLALFAAVILVTSALSLGAYCLTSNGTDTRDLTASPVFAVD